MALTEQIYYEQGTNLFATEPNYGNENEKTHFPIVKESGSKLLQNGKNTLQSTKLLKVQVEVDRTDIEMKAKKEDFRKRMEACMERKKVIEEKQKQMQERTEQFDGFIKENEAKRKRAIQKYQSETKICDFKSKEQLILKEHIKTLSKRHDYLKNKVQRYRKYEKFLNKVVEELPPDFIEVTDTVITSLMSRFHTLASTRDSLIETENSMNEQLEEAKLNLKEIEKQREQLKLTINSELSHKQTILEESKYKNSQTDHYFNRDQKDHLKNLRNAGQITLAIDNIYHNCKRNEETNYDEITLEGKLDVIQEYLSEKSEICRMVMASKSTSSRKNRLDPVIQPKELPDRKSTVSFLKIAVIPS